MADTKIKQLKVKFLGSPIKKGFLLVFTKQKAICISIKNPKVYYIFHLFKCIILKNKYFKPHYFA